MSKTSKTVRKDTVTITLGPKASALVAEIAAAMNTQMPGIGLTNTGILASFVFNGLVERAKLWNIEVPDGLTCCLD